MGYLEKAKSIPRSLSKGSGAKEANYANKGADTTQTPPIAVRNKSLEPQQGVTITAPNRTLNRLPEPLERLLAAAASDVMPKEAVVLPNGIIYSLSGYTMAWGVSYLLGDPDEALRRLWEAHAAWTGRLN